MSRTTPSLSLLPPSLTTSATLTPSPRTPSSSTPSQAGKPFSFPFSPITPSALMPSARTPSARRTRKTPSAVTPSASTPFVPTRFASTPSATRTSTATGAPEPAAVASVYGDNSAAASAVGWTAGGGEGDVGDVTTAAGEGGDVSWDYDFEYGVDGEEPGRQSSLRLFKVIGSKVCVPVRGYVGGWKFGVVLTVNCQESVLLFWRCFASFFLLLSSERHTLVEITPQHISIVTCSAEWYPSRRYFACSPMQREAIPVPISENSTVLLQSTLPATLPSLPEWCGGF